MRYFADRDREKREAALIPHSFGKTYEPFAEVELTATSVIDNTGASRVSLDGETLVIEPDLGGWAFLTPGELGLFSRFSHAPLDALLVGDPAGAGRLPAFIAHLYRRGLVSIDGKRAIDPTIFRDSANFQETHLVEILLTEKCNLACGYCLAGANPHMPAMSSETARRVVDLAFGMEEAGGIGFEFSGGEPFIKFPLMRDLVDYIRGHPKRGKRPVYFTVQTNGTLLNDERVRWLRDNQVQVGVSLDGKPDSQNTSRPQVNGGESFSRLIGGIDLLQRYKIPFGALVVLNRSNVGSVHDLVDFLLDNGIGAFKLNPVAFLGTARENWDGFGLGPQEVLSYFITLIDLVAKKGHPLIEANVRTMLDFIVSKQRKTRCMRTHCGAGDTFQAISAAGDIYPCGRSTQTPAFKLGNVMEPGFSSLSEPARANPYTSQIRERRPAQLEGCVVCEYRQFCQAGCSAQAFERYGTVRHRTPECEFYKTLYPHLMRMLSFDVHSFKNFCRTGYFGNGATLFNDDYSAVGNASVAGAAHVAAA
jgi:radical SAM protein with 4Fe4S-binding SPASM domain